MIPSCSHTGTPRHFHSSTTSGSAFLISARTAASVSPRQSPSSLIRPSISRAGDSALFTVSAISPRLRRRGETSLSDARPWARPDFVREKLVVVGVDSLLVCFCRERLVVQDRCRRPCSPVAMGEQAAENLGRAPPLQAALSRILAGGRSADDVTVTYDDSHLLWGGIVISIDGSGA